MKLKDLLKEMNVPFKSGLVYSNPYAKAFVAESDETISEASIELDTSEYDKDFEAYLKKNKIKARQSGKVTGGYDYFTYTGSPKALKKLIDDYWGDKTLYKSIKEVQTEEKVDEMSLKGLMGKLKKDPKAKQAYNTALDAVDAEFGHSYHPGLKVTKDDKGYKITVNGHYLMHSTGEAKDKKAESDKMWKMMGKDPNKFHIRENFKMVGGVVTPKAVGSLKKNESPVTETKFYAWYNKKKIEVDATSLWDAKQKAIKQLKVPKSKQGLLAIKSAESMKNQDFRYESNLTEDASKVDLLQGLSVEISQYIKKNMASIKKMSKEDKQDIDFVIHILKKSIDKVK